MNAENRQECINEQMFFVGVGEEFKIFRDVNQTIHLAIEDGTHVKSVVFEAKLFQPTEFSYNQTRPDHVAIKANSERLVTQGLIKTERRNLFGLALPSRSFSMSDEVTREFARMRLQTFHDVIGWVEHAIDLDSLIQGKVLFSFEMSNVESGMDSMIMYFDVK